MAYSYITKKRWLKGYCNAHGIATRKGFRVLSDRWGKPARLTWQDALRHAGKPLTNQPTEANISLIKPFNVKLAETAKRELGTKEWPPGSNSGPVMKYLKAAGFKFPTPWCAAFVTWCMREAGWKRNLPPLKGWVPSWESWAAERGYLINKYKAKKGDIVTFQFDADSSGDHIGLILANYGPYKQVVTIEGNAISDSAPGGGVVKKYRPWSSIHRVIRLPRY